jgi:hypothetical protein
MYDDQAIKRVILPDGLFAGQSANRPKLHLPGIQRSCRDACTAPFAFGTATLTSPVPGQQTAK